MLPTITPSIGFEPVLPADPLGAFLRSLAVVRSRPTPCCCPRTAPVGRERARPGRRAASRTTARRLDPTEAAVAAARPPPSRSAARLRWTRREHRLGDLDPFNAMLAVFETGAHLTCWLRRGGYTRTVEDGVEHHRPA